MAIRKMTELVALAIALAGSLDSAAAMVAISAPTIEKITTTMLEKTAPTPFGKNPPCSVRLREVQALVRPDAEHVQGAEHDEGDDRGDLDAGEPEFEFAERAHREQVGGRHQHHQDQREQPQRARRSSR